MSVQDNPQMFLPSSPSLPKNGDIYISENYQGQTDVNKRVKDRYYNIIKSEHDPGTSNEI